MTLGIGATVRISTSPYSDVKRGERGVTSAVKYFQTRNEVWRVRFVDRRSRLFRPGELRV